MFLNLSPPLLSARARASQYCRSLDPDCSVKPPVHNFGRVDPNPTGEREKFLSSVRDAF